MSEEQIRQAAKLAADIASATLKRRQAEASKKADQYCGKDGGPPTPDTTKALDELSEMSPAEYARVVATNPPFSLAEQFIRRALELTRPDGRVAMLLPLNFISAKGRVDLSEPPHKKVLVLTRRIRWVNLEQKKAGPSTNHCWCVWDWAYAGEPTWEALLCDDLEADHDTRTTAPALQFGARRVPQLRVLARVDGLAARKESHRGLDQMEGGL